MASPEKHIADFFFEVGTLAKTPRSGFHFLGTGEQSVAEHTCRVIYIGYALASMEKDADVLKVLKMCLLHDLPEARVSDLNYVHQKYVTKDEGQAVQDLAANIPFGKDVLDTIGEYEERQTKEALIAKDADNLEWITTLKEQVDIGNVRAKEWIKSAVKRLKTESGKKVVKEILKTDSDDWWFSDKKDDWWINRNQRKLLDR
ncbi:MAG: HD domain-containing protein [bacterium]|nr:HD domain-containing protein [bacterium]